MFPITLILLALVSIVTPKSVVIQVQGDCQTLGHRLAEEHGYRYIGQVFDGYCELEPDPSSVNHHRYRRAIEQGMDPAQMLRTHRDVQWAESQVPKVRRKREIVLNDPEWKNMWYLMRHMKHPGLPDLNVTGAWEMGFTGRGHVVTFLDDGLEFDHPDLSENYDKEASTDINGNDTDPSPRYEPTNENKHGTRCAGEVAAKADNQICGVGVAYHASVGGIRMLDGDVTDSVEARSLSHRPDHVEIYSASWGPDDNGLVVDGPGALAKKAFENGVQNGRGGKGSIFVWASGNGGRSSDSCACDGYITSIYTIAVSSVTENGNKPWYLEECSGTLTTAYSSGQGGNSEHDIISTDLHHQCTSHHTGTSAAAPLAAAIYALVLEANTNLTWRDIMYITVLGSRPHAIPSNTELVRNAAGFNVSSKYGFGLMDAGLMTWFASGWTNVPSMSTCQSALISPKKKIDPNKNEIFPIDLTECQNRPDGVNEVNYIEQVQVFITLTTQIRGEMEIYLESPSKTRTQLLPRRNNDRSDQGFQNWGFLTVQLWGEKPHGQWKLEIKNTGGGAAELSATRLVVHGTRDYPIAPRSAPNTNRSSCHVECKPDEPCGTEDTSCTTCRHFKQPLTDGKFRCVGICPEGTYASEMERVCYPCHSQCGSCRNSSDVSCISCKSGLLLVPDAMQCVETCPMTYFTNRALGKCIRCKADCASCQKQPDECTSCPTDFALKDTSCVKASKQCESNEYYSVDYNICRWCDSQCLTCSGPLASQCITCDRKSKYPNLQITACVASCSPGYHLDADLAQCLPCFDTCLNCTSSSETACLSCKLGYIYIAATQRCEKYTGKPFYRDPKTGETQACHPSCAMCQGPKPTDCIGCNTLTEVLLDDGHCVNDCPAGFYINTTTANTVEPNFCAPCPPGCQKCFNPQQCIECSLSEGYKPQGYNCLPTCQPGTYLLDTRCESCQPPCVTCANQTSCLDCSGDLLLFNSQCVTQCPAGSYANKKLCVLCNQLCGTCTGPSEDDCLSCTAGFVFDTKEKECVSQCPNGNFWSKDDQTCHLCTDDCLECLPPGSYCRQCAYPMSLNSTTHQCLSCCTSNLTTADCCQCPPIWDGICVHPLVTPSTRSNWWSVSPLQKIRDRFEGLNHSSQTTVLVLLLVFMLVLLLTGLFAGVSYFRLHLLFFKPPAKHDDVEYVMLEDLDESETLTVLNVNQQ